MPDPGEHRRLVVELAVAVSQFLQESLAGTADDKGFLWHYWSQPFEEGSNILWKLGAASGNVEIEEQNALRGRGPARFKLASATVTRDIIGSYSDFDEQLVERLMVVYLQSMADFRWQGSQLVAGREPFVPPPVFAPQIEALTAGGYLIRDGATVAWTDKIAPSMQAASLWDETLTPPVQPPVNLDATTREQVETLIRANQRINAVVVIQRATGAGLAEAKAKMEELAAALSRA